MAAHPPFHCAAKGISLVFHPQCGIIAELVVTDQGRRISMMHKAPWVCSGIDLPAGAPPHQALLEGDFFCAPFANTAIDNAPLHGWPANGLWHVSPGPAQGQLHATLDQTVLGAQVTKELTLRDGHPFLYQRHTFLGGTGTIPVANHAMLSLPNGALLRYSPKRWFETPGAAPEPDAARGRSCLKYPARSSDPAKFPAADGGTTDLTRYPFGPAHDDLVIGVESATSPLGWTATTRPIEGDLYLSLRHPRRLPMTMLWHSNGGRDYAPWLGRHMACLGIEEGAAPHLLNQTRIETPNLLANSGQSGGVTLSPGTQTEVRHITGCIAWPTGEAVQDVQLCGDTLIVLGENGASRSLPIIADFLDL